MWRGEREAAYVTPLRPRFASFGASRSAVAQGSALVSKQQDLFEQGSARRSSYRARTIMRIDDVFEGTRSDSDRSCYVLPHVQDNDTRRSGHGHPPNSYGERQLGHSVASGERHSLRLAGTPLKKTACCHNPENLFGSVKAR